MTENNQIQKLESKIDELSHKLDKVLEHQNSQYTDIMLLLKEAVDVFDAHIDEDDEGTDDKLYQKAREIVITCQKASTSFLQRKLRIGYSRSATLMDTLEQEGVVSPASDSQPRQVLIK